MQKYNLANLTDRDFEELCKDILEYKESKKYRTFKAGKDSGIDILSLDEGIKEVGQVKHYGKSSQSTFISNLKKEKNKLVKLDANRYILFTSLELTVSSFEKVLQLFQPYLKKEDIYDGKVIQDILNEEDAKYIIDKWEKLWMPSPYFLQMIYDKFKNREYDYKKEEIVQDVKKFVKPAIYNEIIECLEKKGIAIIHGEPGAGKTTTARNIIANYISKGYKFIYGHSNELNKVNRELCTDEDVIVLLDDFLGSNVMNFDSGANDNELEDILKKCYRSKNKKIVLTTRTYIYNNAIQKLEKFCNIDKYINKFLLTSNQYTYLEKAKILYNHLYYNNIMEKEEYKYLLENQLYLKIIVHKNFSPKMIAMLCEHFEDLDKNNIKKEITAIVKNPNLIWEKEYNKLSKFEKIILHIIIFFEKEISEECVEEQFGKMVENEEIEDDLFQKSIMNLMNSFIKTSIDNDGRRVLSIVNNNIVDFIIQKIDNREIKIQKYIDNALYIDILKNMYDLLITNTIVKDEILNKLENEFYNLKHTKGYWMNNVFHMLSENCYMLPEREKIVKVIIEETFKSKNYYFMDFLLQQSNDKKFYDYILMEFYKRIKTDNEILKNMTNIHSIELYSNAVNDLKDKGFDISFVSDKYDIFIESLVFAIANEVEEEIKISMVLEEDMKDVEDYVLEKIDEILDEFFLLFEIDAYDIDDIYSEVLEEVIDRKKKLKLEEFREEIVDWIGVEDATAEERYREEVEEIIKMFENRVPNENEVGVKPMEVRSFIRMGNEFIWLNKDEI